MDLPDSAATHTHRARAERPPPCPACAGPSWWNGWRQTFPQLSRGRIETWLARARCKSGKCTDYVVRPGELYPHRQYQPDVVAKVVAAIAIGGETPAEAAAAAKASATSARRWTGWVARIVEVGAALALAVRLKPDLAAGEGLSTRATTSPTRGLAAQVLHALEHLGEALVRSGVVLVSESGLGRVLEWQHRQHGDVVHLVVEPRSFSPGMALGVAGGRL